MNDNLIRYLNKNNENTLIQFLFSIFIHKNIQDS